MKYIFSLMLCSLTLGLLGCATHANLPLEANRTAPDSFQVKIAEEVYGLRLDIIRNSKGEKVVDKVTVKSTAAPSNDPSTYSWIGIDLGNGLFMDSNGNLAVDLVRLYNFNKDFNIQEKDFGLIQHAAEYVKTSDTFTRKGDSNDLVPVKVTFTPDETDIDFDAPPSRSIVYHDIDEITYVRAGFGIGKTTLRQVSERRVEFPGFITSNMYIAKNEDKMDLGKFTFKRKKNVIEITQTGLLLDAEPLTYIRTQTGCFFINLTGDSYAVSREGDTISVEKNGKLDRTYKVTLPVEAVAN